MASHRSLAHGLLFICTLSVILFVKNYHFGITLHMIVYFFVASNCVKSLLRPNARSVRKTLAMLLYYSILLYQISFLMMNNFDVESRLVVAVLLILTYLIEQLFFLKPVEFCVNPLDENSLSFQDLLYLKKRVAHRANHIKKLSDVVTFQFIRDICDDFPRNFALNYMAKDSLNQEYFQLVEDSMEEPYIYLVFSDTGSPASNFIGLFTNKPYNHISFSFDSQLKTLISYNGGERVSPPGLNPEMLEYFYQKEDASIRIYRLEVTLEQKKAMGKRVELINQEGSAYNLLGVTLRKTIQPNMMVCSEFVYNLLDSVGAAYFTKTALDVKPADLIELDYERKLEFMEAIQLSSICDELVEKGKPLPKPTNKFKLATKS